MSYTNSHTIAELQKNTEFVRITNAGAKESGPHDINVIN
jgi:IMP dehydrogenase